MKRKWGRLTIQEEGRILAAFLQRFESTGGCDHLTEGETWRGHGKSPHYRVVNGDVDEASVVSLGHANRPRSGSSQITNIPLACSYSANYNGLIINTRSKK